MPTQAKILLDLYYENEAEKYLRSLPPEHFMEATTQATQRKITVECLDLVEAQRPDFHLFNELLVQYPLDAEHKKLGQVVPDNMVVLSKEPIKAVGSYSLPVQPVGPFWVLEYVSKHSQRKDYEDNMVKYEQDLKVPFYLLFYPDTQDMTLYKLTKGKYVSVKPNKQGRCPMAKVNLEIGLLDGWMRYWYKGELLPLSPELLDKLEETQKKLAEATKRAEQETRRAEQEARRAEQEQQSRLAAEQEVERLRAELAQLRSQQGDPS